MKQSCQCNNLNEKLFILASGGFAIDDKVSNPVQPSFLAFFYVPKYF